MDLGVARTRISAAPKNRRNGSASVMPDGCANPRKEDEGFELDEEGFSQSVDSELQESASSGFDQRSGFEGGAAQVHGVPAEQMGDAMVRSIVSSTSVHDAVGGDKIEVWL